MTDYQFSELMKVLNKIDKTLNEIQANIPGESTSEFGDIYRRLGDINGSIAAVEKAIDNLAR